VHKTHFVGEQRDQSLPLRDGVGVGAGAGAGPDPKPKGHKQLSF
jgi:hypothetical protein